MTKQFEFSPEIMNELTYQCYHHPSPLVQQRTDAIRLKAQGIEFDHSFYGILQQVAAKKRPTFDKNIAYIWEWRLKTTTFLAISSHFASFPDHCEF